MRNILKYADNVMNVMRENVYIQNFGINSNYKII